MPARAPDLMRHPWSAALRRPMAWLLAPALGLALAGCQSGREARLDQLIQRQEQLELQVQQLEQRLNRPATAPGTAPGKAPAGVVKSLTYRSGTSDDRLRIYWADGSTSDLPCTKEQNTLVCG
jgi:outer membrane murein-binding lipoprotein Lpp